MTIVPSALPEGQAQPLTAVHAIQAEGAHIIRNLPLPPSMNRIWHPGVNKKGQLRIYRSKEVKQYKHDLGWLVKAAGVRCIDGDAMVAVVCFIYRAKGDVDNYAKVLLDSLQGVFYENDRQVRTITFNVFDVPYGKEPHMNLRLEVLE